MTTASCECREEIDKQLAQYNTRVTQVFTLSGNSIGMPWPIETQQVETGRGKAKAMRLFASFCPFCGKPATKNE